MPTAISTIRNLGPATEAQFAKAGITSAKALRDLGADEAYRRCLLSGTAPHFVGYYVLHMALQGRPWNDCKGDEKKALRTRFDALVAGIRSDSSAELDKALDFLGVRRKV